jgi:hypothetical protein
VRGVGGVVLHPDLAQPEPVGQAVGTDERGDPRRERRARLLLEREKVRVAPDRLRARLDPSLGLGGVEPREVVTHLKRPEALLAHVASLERVARPTFLALKRLYCCHCRPFKSKNLRRLLR